jgi:hypothetical protein
MTAAKPLLDDDVNKKLRVARYLYSLAEAHITEESELSIFAGAHLLQDAVELFLVACTEYLNIPINIKPNSKRIST